MSVALISAILVLLLVLALAVSNGANDVAKGIATLVGLRLKRDARSVQWTTVRDMLLAWLITLPAAATIAAMIYWAATKLV